ncbi:hypothetical protein OH807_34295 [Kitasatospora sp. NBC_01560]|uniref:hypothetical protein n=1 Tax=Kitasatospora sp. NBC_01560 TaxID=2975965 RepID=UPI003868D3ED
MTTPETPITTTDPAGSPADHRDAEIAALRARLQAQEAQQKDAELAALRAQVAGHAPVAATPPQIIINNSAASSASAAAAAAVAAGRPPRRRQSAALHVLLFLFTAGIGNILYAMSVSSWNRRHGW